MFERGRLLGQLESETKWQFKDAGRRTRQAVKDAAARLEKERDYDWSNLDSKELIQRLVERNVISIENGELLDKTTLDAFADICVRFQQERERKQKSSLRDVQIDDEKRKMENSVKFQEQTKNME